MAVDDVGSIGRETHVAQGLEGTQQHRKWWSACSDAFKVAFLEISCRLLDEALHQLIMMLCRRSAEKVAHLEKPP